MPAPAFYDRRNFYVAPDSDQVNVFRLDIELSQYPSVGDYYVSDDEVGKPWIISYRIWGIPQLWWFLMKYNHIKRLDTDLSSGKKLSFPALSVFTELYERYLNT